MSVRTRITIIFLLLSNCIIAQPFLDSLKNLLPKSVDSAKARILNDLSAKYRAVDLEMSLKYAEEGLSLSSSLNLNKQIVRAKINLGLYYYLKAKYAPALLQLNSALTLANQISDSALIGNANNNIGAVYFNLSEYSKALDYYLTALKIREALSDTLNIAASLNNLGNVYTMTESYNSALEYYNKSLSFKRMLKDINGEIQTVVNLGSVYKNMNDYTTALSNFETAKKLCEKYNNPIFLSAIYTNMGGIYSAQLNYKEALRYHLLAKNINEENEDMSALAVSLYNVGDTYTGLKQCPKGISYLKQAFDLAGQIDALEVKKNVSYSLSEVYAKMGDYKSAFEYQRKYSALRDSLVDATKASEIGKLAERYQIEKTLEMQKRADEESNRIRQAIEKRRNNIQYLMISIVLIVLFILLFLSGKYQLQSKYIEMLSFISLLLLFEFINVLLDPYTDALAKSVPVLKLGINAGIALLLSPLDILFEKLIQKYNKFDEEK